MANLDCASEWRDLTWFYSLVCLIFWLIVLWFTAFEQHFSAQFNNTFKYKSDRFNKTDKHRFSRVHLSVQFISRSQTNPFRNGSCSVGLLRSAYVIVSIVSLVNIKTLASHISEFLGQKKTRQYSHKHKVCEGIATRRRKKPIIRLVGPRPPE